MICHSSRRCSTLHSILQPKFLWYSCFWKSSWCFIWFHMVWASLIRSDFNDIGISRLSESEVWIICSVTFWVEISFKLLKTCFLLIKNTRDVFDWSVKERWRVLVCFIRKYVWSNIFSLTFIPGVRYFSSSRLKNDDMSLKVFSVISRDARINFISWIQLDSYSTK